MFSFPGILLWNVPKIPRNVLVWRWTAWMNAWRLWFSITYPLEICSILGAHTVEGVIDRLYGGRHSVSPHCVGRPFVYIMKYIYANGYLCDKRRIRKWNLTWPGGSPCQTMRRTGAPPLRFIIDQEIGEAASSWCDEMIQCISPKSMWTDIQRIELVQKRERWHYYCTIQWRHDGDWCGRHCLGHHPYQAGRQRYQQHHSRTHASVCATNEKGAADGLAPESV